MFCVPPVSPNLAINNLVYWVIKCENVGHCSVYFLRGIAKRPNRNKQPTPRYTYMYNTPTYGVSIGTHRRFMTAYPSVDENWRFS